MSHAYLFVGGKGVGKRETARLLASSFFCQNKNGVEPCGQCPECIRIKSGNHPDLVLIRPDGRSIKKLQVAELIKAFSYRGVESEKKVFIVEQADAMTAQAANSLLKFIEEPQGETLSILLTENVHGILDTILSRCQILHFTPLAPDDLEKKLARDGAAQALAKTVAAITADMTEAEALVHDEWFAKARSVVIHFMEELFTRPNHAIITLYDQCTNLFSDSKQLQVGLDLMLIWLEDLLSLQSDRSKDLVFIDGKERLETFSNKFSVEQTAMDLSAVLEAKRRLNANGQPLSVLEQLALRLQKGAVYHV